MIKRLCTQMGSQKNTARSRMLSVGLLMAAVLSILPAMAMGLNTYEVTDGRTTETIYSYTSDPRTAARMAGFDMEDYVVTKEQAVTDGFTKLALEKKFDVDVFADGRTLSTQTIDASVADILKQNGIVLGEYDETKPSKDTILTGATAIEVVRVKKTTAEQYEEIPFKTVKRNSYDLSVGQKRTIQAGQTGQIKKKVEIITKNGKETGRTVLSEQVMREPQTCIIENGVGGAVVTRGGEILRYKRVLTVTATAYSTENWPNKTTASGTVARVGAIAVDPDVIPLGSRIYITSLDGKSWIYGTAVAEDTGGAIKGNKIDLFYNTQAQCRKFGIRKAKVYIL